MEVEALEQDLGKYFWTVTFNPCFKMEQVPWLFLKTLLGGKAILSY